RFVAVSLRPASSVLSRTLARTGSVLRFETARLTTDRPRARFSCMTESFTLGSLQCVVRAADPRIGSGARAALGSTALGDRAGSVVVGIFSLSSHPVITVVMVWTRWTRVLRHERTAGGRAGTHGGREERRSGCGGGRRVDDLAAPPDETRRTANLSTST